MNSHTGTPLPTLPEMAFAGLRPLVAVLPFQATRGGPGLQMLATELADAVRERLAQDAQLRSILINSGFLAEAPPHALELVCRELAVGMLITGHCHGTLPTASLYIEAADTRQWIVRWAHVFHGNARTLLDPHSEEMSLVVAGLRRVLVKQPRG